MASSVMEQISECTRTKTNFLLSGGAGSGKTYTLIQTLHDVFEHTPQATVACITYTNVAVEEIKERSSYSQLHVSTLHDFLWDIIKGFQKNLKQVVLNLLAMEKEIKGSGLTYDGEDAVNEDSFNTIKYRNYRKIENGVITHDDLLKVATTMFARYPLLAKILCDKFDYIFVDEYQDTQAGVIEIFLTHIKKYAKGTLGIGFFGDKMQSIYSTGVGNIATFVKSGIVTEIIKEDNYRCSVDVISLLNKLRTDIEQKPAKKNLDGSIANRKGSATFIYSNADFDIDKFKKSDFVLGWNFTDPKQTKVLFLTHRLIARRFGFDDLLASFSSTDKIIGNDPDRLAKHLLKMGGLLYYFSKNDYAYVIGNIQRKLKTNSDKKVIAAVLAGMLADQKETIESLITTFDRERLVRKDDRLTEFIKNHMETYEKLKNLPISQVIAYYTYYNDFSVYSTQHGIKGAQFNNVLVVMDNGRWSNYNFKHLFEQTANKELVIQRTERIFYVCCSRAMDNLIVFYPAPTSQAIARAKALFGTENVKSI